MLRHDFEVVRRPAYSVALRPQGEGLGESRQSPFADASVRVRNLSRLVSGFGFEQHPWVSAIRGLPTPYKALGICTAITAVIVVITVRTAPEGYRVPLTIEVIVAGAVVCTAVALAFHFREEALRLKRSAAADAAEAATLIAAANDAASHHAAESHRNVRDRAAAMAAFAGAAGRMQAMTTSMLADLREMEDRHSDTKVLADLLYLDHRTSQAGRLADSIAVLSGARSGRRWAKPIATESILRGAMGRTAGYQRVRLRSVAEVAIAGHAAEGVMHVLAELLDNACNFSPPTTEVHVYAAEVPAGLVLTIEDSGLVMSKTALRRAEQAVSGSGARGSDLSTLSGTRLGLAVVGHLARKHGLTVSFRPSAIGGTGVVVLVPRDLVTQLVSVTSVPALTAGPNGKEPDAPVSVTESGLPIRQRGTTFAAVQSNGKAPPQATTDSAPPASAGFAAFQHAVRGDSATRPAAPPAPSAAMESDR